MVTGDRGAAAIWSVALTALLIGVAVVIGMVGSVAVARARVATVADLAAVAAARTASCASAQGVADRNGMRLANCTIAQGDALVRVASPVPELTVRIIGVLGGRLNDIVGEARAGYASESGVGAVMSQRSWRQSGLRQDEIEQTHGEVLVERVVPIAALGGLHA